MGVQNLGKPADVILERSLTNHAAFIVPTHCDILMKSYPIVLIIAECYCVRMYLEMISTN